MTEVSTKVTLGNTLEAVTVELSHTVVFLGGSSGTGGGAALPAGGNPSDVLTKRSTANNDVEWRAPSVPWNSTNW